MYARPQVLVLNHNLYVFVFQSTKAKQKATDQKLQHTEEAFSHAKQLYDEITDELYEELPAFYDR